MELREEEDKSLGVSKDQQDSQARQGNNEDQDQERGAEVEEEFEEEKISEEFEHDQASLNHKNKITPLVFCCRLGCGYLISFSKKQIFPFFCRTLAFIFILSIVTAFSWFSVAARPIRVGLLFMAIFDFAMYLLIFLIDAGTLLEDEEEQLHRERIYCQSCKLYRYYSTKHCIYCARCVKGYDHHCSFFGKCIGRNNICMFYGFIMASGIFGMGSIATLTFSIFQGLV